MLQMHRNEIRIASVSRFQSRNVAYHELDSTRVTINEEYARGETIQRARPDIIYRVKLTPAGTGGEAAASVDCLFHSDAKCQNDIHHFEEMERPSMSPGRTPSGM